MKEINLEVEVGQHFKESACFKPLLFSLTLPSLNHPTDFNEFCTNSPSKHVIKYVPVSFKFNNISNVLVLINKY